MKTAFSILVLTLILSFTTTRAEARYHYSRHHHHHAAAHHHHKAPRTAIRRVRPAAAVVVAAVPRSEAGDQRDTTQPAAPGRKVDPPATATRLAAKGRHGPRTRVAAIVRHHRMGITTSGMPGPLAAKVAEITSSCGSRVISGFRRGARVAGSGHMSNHALGRAADIQGNPGCIYAHLKGWPGGYSTDYARAPGGAHVHVSFNPGGMEWGLRFVHGGHRHHHYANRHRGRPA